MGALLTAEHVTFAYGAKQRNVLEDVSVQVDEGQIITLLGPNGSGKSTLLNILCGLLRPNQGRVTLRGEDVHKLSAQTVAQSIAYVPQHTNLSFDYTVYDYVLMGRTAHMGLMAAPSRHDRELVEAALEQMELTQYRHRSVREMSGGEQQKASIARALVQEPQLVILDEPTSALDYGNQVRVLQLVNQLRNKGYAVIMTTHNPDHPLLLRSDTWLLDRAAHLSVGTAEESITQETMSALYGNAVYVSHIDDIHRTACIIQLESELPPQRDIPDLPPVPAPIPRDGPVIPFRRI